MPHDDVGIVADTSAAVVKGENNTSARLSWVILAAALLAMSSAGSVLRKLETVPPLLRASWRLQATSALLGIGFMFQWRQQPDDIRRRFVKYDVLGILLASGLCLGLHFGAWVISLDLTTLPHSLLWVTSHPLIIVVGSLLLRQHVWPGEIAGSIVGFAGGGIVLLDAKTDTQSGGGGKDASLQGDACAFLGAVAIVGYLIAGRSLRSWLPTFLYAFPVTSVAAVSTLVGAIVLEGADISLSDHGWTGYFGDARSFLLVAYLACFPGIVGHTGMNFVLRYISTIAVSITLILEPVIGSLIGTSYLLSCSSSNSGHNVKQWNALQAGRLVRPILLVCGRCLGFPS